MNILKKVLAGQMFTAIVTALLVQLAQAQELSAVETAELGVRTLLQTAEDSKALYTSDSEAYFRRIEDVLSSFVDFNAVAEVVMSRYANSASDQQKQRFADILKTTLTRFYGASLVSYSGQQLVFLPAGNPNPDPRADTVVGMELQGDVPFRLQYQMFLDEQDQWKLKNLSLAGINLGRQYYTQFAALMVQHDNDIDSVLDNWK